MPPVAPVAPNSFIFPLASVTNTLPAAFAVSWAVPRNILEPTCRRLKFFPVAPNSKALLSEGTKSDTTYRATDKSFACNVKPSKRRFAEPAATPLLL